MSKRRADDDLNQLRLKSRQSYLEKRADQQLALLAKEIEEDARLDRSKLSRREIADIDSRAQAYAAAVAHRSIDDTGVGYVLPSSEGVSKSELLNKKSKDDTYVSEFAQFESEQQSKAKATTGVSDRTRPQQTEDEYEYVFDPEAAIKWQSEAPIDYDPEKLRLQSMLNAAEKKRNSIDEVRKSLPVSKYRTEILDAIKNHNIICLSASTGSGKSTQIPAFLYESGFTKPPPGSSTPARIICTQPRRVACMSVAARVAEEQGVVLGRQVGYRIRYEDKTDPLATHIVFETEGILLREISSSPLLDNVSVLILDEVHERTKGMDVILGLTKALSIARPDLRIILMSATSNSQKMSQFFDGCPIFYVPGQAFPVDVHYLTSPEANYIAATVTTALQIHITQAVEGGDILAFLPGELEIITTCELIEDSMRKLGGRVPELVICPIYSTLPPEQQAKIFEPAPPGTRKIIVATNIAETSLTVDGIMYVIDCGYVKENQYSSRTNMEQLVTVPCSKASVDQRKGRAGRTGPGKCFRLWTRQSQYDLASETTPEILRSNLLDTVLQMKALGINDLLNFDFLDPPNSDLLISALESLYALKCLSPTGELTRLGRQMAELPLDPKLSAVLLHASEYSCVEEALTIVAMLSESGSLFIRPPPEKKMYAESAKSKWVSREGGDFGMFLRIYNDWVESDYSSFWCKDQYLNYKGLVRVRNARDQLEKLCDKVEIPMSSAGDDYIAIGKAFTAGFFQNAATLARDGQSYRTVKGGNNVFLHPSSVLKQMHPPVRTLLFYECVMTSKEYLRSCIPIEPSWLFEIAPHYHKKEVAEASKKMPRAPAKAKVAKADSISPGSKNPFPSDVTGPVKAVK
ncbi:P-loop containing nucleoside triphosphate hydrolase protein [Lophiotrema nucula]|uniref:RNA helicase n=1 Tax=Lophiotrema nucula TaxID=690887 RepID=A0A6A5Z746_9PLEO|nr:P-loop containing nucleoside triphosphate hydrolase protein [Lophiotrema nucula]